jgi:hypothetical protein
VFVSFSSEDRAVAGPINEALQKALPSDYETWFDASDIRAGDKLWQPIDDGLQKAVAAVVLVGPKGLGPWQSVELSPILDRKMRNEMRLVVATLPGTDAATIPLLLRGFKYVRFDTPSDAVTLAAVVRGVTGQEADAPRSAPASPAPAQDQVEFQKAIDNLKRLLLDRSSVTFFVGTAVNPRDPAFPPTSSELAQDLFRELKLIDGSNDKLLPPVDVAGAYYAVGNNDDVLESFLRARINERSKRISPVHEHLANLFRKLKKRPEGRMRRPFQQLVVASCLDLTLERALLLAGVPFTRIVQHPDMTEVEINVYQSVSTGGDGELEIRDPDKACFPVPRNRPDALDDAISNCGRRTQMLTAGPNTSSTASSLSLTDMPEPIVYKFRGSADVQGSCALTTDQYLKFAQLTHTARCVPAALTSIIADSAAVFLGHSLLDPDFRLIANTLLENSNRQRTRYAIEPRPLDDEADPYRQMERPIWKSIAEKRLERAAIKTVEAQPDDFLAQLTLAISASLGGA